MVMGLDKGFCSFVDGFKISTLIEALGSDTYQGVI